MTRITIIETGLLDEKSRARYGSFPEMFERLIGAEDRSITFDVVSAVNGEALPDPRTLQAILITGSPAGVYDKLDWIAPLEDFVRAAYVSEIPMIGVCFGHQLMAQSLGGIVRKSEKGWGIGRHVYDVAPGNGIIDGERIAIAASHQDQVAEHQPGRGRSCPRPSPSMPDCFTAMARHSLCSRIRSSTPASPMSVVSCAKARRPMPWSPPPKRP